MSEAEYPISLPDIPNDLEFGVSPRRDEVLLEAARDIMGLHAVREVHDKPNKPKPPPINSEDVLEEPLEHLELGAGRPLRAGSNDPGLSGIRVVNAPSAERDDGKIRASRAIEKFLHDHNGRASRAALMERLTAAGFSDKRADELLQTACDQGKIVSINDGRFYKLA